MNGFTAFGITEQVKLNGKKKVKGNCTQSQPKEKNYMTLLLELLTSRILRITVLRGRTAYVYTSEESRL